MNKNKRMNSDREIANKFDALFDSIPELQTEDELNQFLIETGYVPIDLKEKGENLVKELMSNNWRFISDEVLESQRVGLLEKKIKSDLPRETLIEKIKKGTQALTVKGFATSLPTGVAHRNLDKETVQDLASLLRQIEHIAEQAGIDLGEE